MQSEVRMGGKPVLRVFAQGERDIGPILTDGYLQRAVTTRHPSTTIEPVVGASGRIDQMVQRLAGGGVPDELREMGFDRQFLDSQFSTPAADQDVDVVILSAASDLLATHWVHRDRGWILNPPADWRSAWPAELRIGFEEAFEESALLSAEEYFAGVRDVVLKIRDASGAHVVLFGASTIGEPMITTYAGHPDDHRLRAHRVNAAQIRLSMVLGVSVVDVDRVIANVGAEGEVAGPLDYNARAVNAICSEIDYVLDDIGFFENRPLVAQVGQEGGA